MGQIRLVQYGLTTISDKGSFTLISGILGDEAIAGGTAASTVNKALEGFVMSASQELPRGIRLNLISPGLLEESVADYDSFFPGFVPVTGEKVGLAYVKSVFGNQTGKLIRV